MAKIMVSPTPNLPIIDLTKDNLKLGTSSWHATSHDIHHALEDYGCFIALYDKISSQLVNEVFDVVKELFDLPTETKLKNLCDVVYNGYVGLLPQAPIHESLGIPEATSIEGVESFANLMWPSGNKRFCEAMLSYAKEMAELEQMVDKMVFESYGVEKHYDSHVGSTTYLLRPIKYRPPEINECTIGSNIHTDKCFLAILHQNQVNGLEVEARNGEWITVDFPPSSFVIMAGDAYQAWSNDRIYSPRHRVIMRENNPRYCLSFFSFNKGITEIPEELVDEEHPLKFKPFDNLGLAQFYFSNISSWPLSVSEGSAAKIYCGIST